MIYFDLGRMQRTSDILNKRSNVNNRFRRDIERAKPDIERFSLSFGVELIKITTIEERGFPEPAYVFSDNLGAYTLDALKSSLA